MLALVTLGVVLCTASTAHARSPIVAERTLALRTAMSGTALLAYTVTQKDGVTIKAYVTHPDKLYLVATGPKDAKFEISMSKAGTAILRDGKKLPDVPPALQAIADYLRTQWDTITVAHDEADVDADTGAVEVPFSGRMTPDLKKLVPAQTIRCTYEKLTNHITRCERADLTIEFYNYQTVSRPPVEAESLQVKIRRAMRDLTAFHVLAVSPRGTLTATYSKTTGLAIDRPVAENQTHTDPSSPPFVEFNRGFRDWRVLTELPDRVQDAMTYGAFASTFRSPEVLEPVRVQCLYDHESYRLVGCFGPMVTIRYSNYAP